MTISGGEPIQASLIDLLKVMVEKNASDLHITTGSHPSLRIDGQLVPLRRVAVMTPQDTQRLCFQVLSEEQRERFQRTCELDLSFGVKNLARFRANLFMQRGAVAGAFRAIPFRILSQEELGLPPIVAELATRPRGLVLVTGPTGSGKSTTLASLVDKINTETRSHIMTVEDPIEYMHANKSSVVNQREVGTDTATFRDALRYVLRQDPDVVLIGELRDHETIEAAMTIAETGHLVFGTLHTNSAWQAITRIIDIFPAHQQQQVRIQLSFVLQGIVTQLLVPKAGVPGRVAAVEVLVPTPGIRTLIREDKIHQIYSLMQVGQQNTGMQTMNQALANLALRRVITLDEAMVRSSDPAELQQLVDGSSRFTPPTQAPR
ncbi:MAG: type IV pilus twitching motility protein PilT [Myxococcales bacterium]|nr:type IV pilus twitching motility protein PilT [Myxococcales bacterium]